MNVNVKKDRSGNLAIRLEMFEFICMIFLAEL